ncbi:DNA-binding domain-containing protein [Acuticoccus kandeliae]|uniref:HvfC/BufC N-terminal domain-containing protein n=1 Tax=Acuticoccus kandeliae TaxID=2073160 RepID=UPI000D3E9049|nr:DNA-binding domain-containing protein [Acuticoccus kandeliae]
MPPETPRDVAREGEFAAALGERTPVAGLHDGRGRDASDRFGVYRNTVLASLCEALASTFKATRRLMGEAFFDAAAADYAAQNRPSSPLLFRYGEAFPDFLATLPGLAPYPFVVEAARIEAARVAAYHAADAPPLDPAALAAVAPEALAALVFVPHPAARLLMLPDGGVAAWLANQSPPLHPVEAAAALVTRPALAVMVTPLGESEAEFAARLLAGRPLGEAATVDNVDLSAALASLLSIGAFAATSVAQTP